MYVYFKYLVYNLDGFLNVMPCLCIEESQSGELTMHNWYDSVDMCNLMTIENLTLLNDNVHGWAGGIYFNTSWMTYEGAYNSK